MTLLGGLLKERAIKDNQLWGRWARGGDTGDGAHLAGVTVTRDTAMSLSAVWACVGLISDVVSMLPLDSFIKDGDVRRPLRPQPHWIDEPNPEQERHQWVGQQLVALLLDGTAYVHTIRDRRGDILEAWNAPPWMVTPRRVRRGEIVYDVRDPERGMITLDQTEMFHIPAMSWPGQIRGMAPLEAARHVLGTGLGAQEFAERFYGQGFNVPGVVEVPGEMDDVQAKQLQKTFSRAHSSLKRSHLPAVLTAGATWNPSTITAEQAQFLQSRSFSVTEVARWFRVPPWMIADVEKSTSWGTGIEQQGIGFVTYTTSPWTGRLEQGYTRRMSIIGPQARAYHRFNVNALMRGDFKTRMEGYAIGRNWGWFSADDVNAYEDRQPLPDGLGAQYLTPGNMRPADEPYRPDPTAAPPPGGPDA